MLLPASLQRKRKRQEIPKPTSSTTHQNAEAGPSSSVPRRASTELENEQQARSCGDQATDGPVSSSKKVKQETQQASPAAGWQEWYRDEPTKRQVILRWLATSLLVIAQDEAVKQRDSKGKGKARAADGSDDSGWTPLSKLLSAHRDHQPLTDTADSSWLRSTSGRILAKLDQRQVVDAIRSTRQSPMKVNNPSTSKASKGNDRKRKHEVGEENGAASSANLFDLRLSVINPVFKLGTEVLDPTTSGGGWDVRITRERPLQEVLKGVGEEESATDELAARSVYLENIPPIFETLEGLFYLLPKLVPKFDRSTAIHRIRPAISPPAIGAGSAGRGAGNKKVKPDFTRVVVTLESAKQARRLVKNLPWRAVDDDRPLEEDLGGSPAKDDINDRQLWRAIRGTQTRAMLMTDFEQLAEEYRAYKRQTDKIVERHFGPTAKPPVQELQRREPHCTHAPKSGLRADSPVPSPLPLFPHGCLVFLRNLPLTTNKTALKALCNAHLPDGHLVDYVDWVKGTDAAHVRCANAEDAGRVVAGLNCEGGAEESVTAELVEGKREEIYWMGLPERIRVAAMNAGK